MKKTIQNLILVGMSAVLLSACSGMAPKLLVQEKIFENHTWKIDVKKIYDNNPAFFGRVLYTAPSGYKPISVYVNIRNISKSQSEIDLSNAYLVKGKMAVRPWIYVRYDSSPIRRKEPPSTVVNPGDSIGRQLLYIYPDGKLPEYFVIQGIGKIKIPKPQISG